MKQRTLRRGALTLALALLLSLWAPALAAEETQLTLWPSPPRQRRRPLCSMAGPERILCPLAGR